MVTVIPAIDCRLVVVTQDNPFYNALSAGFVRLGGIGAVSVAENLLSTESKLIKHKSNVIILDVDRALPNTVLLKQWQEKYSLLVVITGHTPTLPRALVEGGFTHFIAKPAMVTPLLIDSFIKSVKQKMDAFTAPLSKMRPMDLFAPITERDKIIAIASSTGGTDALETIFRHLPGDIPPILVVQHMPSGFTKLFANRLNNLCKMDIKEATNMEYLCNGTVYIAPADLHMTLTKSNNRLALHCAVGQKVHGVMPAADVLFQSIAPVMKANVLGIILTGMGADGAKGLYAMHLNGAKTIGQNKETCVVYGMPKAAYELGALDLQLPLAEIAPAILKYYANKNA